MALQDGLAVLGMPNSTVDGGLQRGAAYAFERPAGGWTGQIGDSQRFVASDGLDFDGFGGNVALSGRTAVVGLFNVGQTPAAYIFEQEPPSFEGFFAPVDNAPVLNIAKAGQTIPLNWRLTDVNGVPVLNLASVTVTAVSLSCSLRTALDQIEGYSAGGTGLQNLGDGYYQYNWKTPKSYADSCKTVKLDLGEGPGQEHTAHFQFK